MKDEFGTISIINYILFSTFALFGVVYMRVASPTSSDNATGCSGISRIHDEKWLSAILHIFMFFYNT